MSGSFENVVLFPPSTPDGVNQHIQKVFPEVFMMGMDFPLVNKTDEYGWSDSMSDEEKDAHQKEMVAEMQKFIEKQIEGIAKQLGVPYWYASSVAYVTLSAYIQHGAIIKGNTLVSVGRHNDIKASP